MGNTLSSRLALLIGLGTVAQACATQGNTGLEAGIDMAIAAGCIDGCEAEGETECRTPGFRQCVRDADGCLDWAPVTSCNGMTCALGTCVDCAHECQDGSLQCGPGGGVQRCSAAGDADPCSEWVPEVACPAGESCSAGECRPSDECVDECAKVDDRQCNGDGFQTCETNPANDCLRWGPTTDCPDAQTCSSDECRPADECVDGCMADSLRCSLEGVETCGNYDGDACSEWSAVVPCAAAEICSNGRCALSCANECGQEGLRQCDGNDFQICGRHDADDCLEWGLATPCDADQTCSNGNCREACINECADGTVQCGGEGVQTCGNFDGDECMEWSEAVPCDQNESCSGGQCSEQCQNECGAANARQCSANGFQVCGNTDGDACLEWGDLQGCPAGQVCANGECAQRCVNECADGSAQCAGNGAQTCGNFDADDCAEWSAVSPCAAGQSCSNGLCAATCADECVLGANRCAMNGLQGCGNFDDDACNDWGRGAPCPGDQLCSNNACADSCIDECSARASRCSANGFERCGQFDGDPCQDWSLSTPCPVGQVCSSGACAPTCNDECPRGAVQCAGNGFQSCGEFDADNCLEWGAVAPCQDRTSCSAGVCSPFCSHECDANGSRCGGAGVQLCGQFDQDNCRDWGPGIPCPGLQVCSNGACAAECAGECVVGQARCDGAGVQSCGDFDADACLEFSPVVACARGEVCSDGACVALDMGCDSDDACPQGLVCAFGACIVPIGCLDDADCPFLERCDVLAGVCRADAPSGLGDPCLDDAQCLNGLTCVAIEDGGYCTAGCSAEALCPSGSTCYNLDAETPDLGVCFTDCADDAACLRGQICFASGGPLGGACFLAECREDVDCGGDAVLHIACEAGRCVVENGCDAATGEGCAMGTECVVSDGRGVCLAPCDALDDACAAGSRCLPVNADGTGYCIDAGNVPAGGACAGQFDCARGQQCIDDGLGNGSCRPLCDTGVMGGCPALESCVSLVGRVGACLPDCENDCAPGDTRCDANGTQLCGQADNDLCAEWTATTPCLARESCNELTATCEPACRVDADCRNDLIAIRCVAGQCRVQSECEPADGSGCDAPEACFVASADGRAGVCLQDCDPLGEDCAGALSCVAFGGGSFCLTPGVVPAGGPCESSAECVAGAACVNTDSGGLCFALCDVSAGAPNVCARGQSCLDLEIDNRLGACVDDCVDECVEGASECGPNGGTSTCVVDADADACAELDVEVHCPAQTRCNPASNACEVFCAVDADCDFGNGIPYACVNATCEIRACQVGNDACLPGRRDGVCIPQTPDQPGALGYCLAACDPLVAGGCGEVGRCDYYPVSDVAVVYICLNDGVLGEYEVCGGDLGECLSGSSCIPFEDDAGGTVNYCVRYCNAAQPANGGCDAGAQVCTQIPYFRAGVGVCLPSG